MMNSFFYENHEPFYVFYFLVEKFFSFNIPPFPLNIYDKKANSLSTYIQNYIALTYLGQDFTGNLNIFIKNPVDKFKLKILCLLITFLKFGII